MTSNHDPECIFCKIIHKEIPAALVLENEHVVAFKDINPQAPVHMLVIPKAHIPKLGDLDQADPGVLSHMIAAANALAKQHGVFEEGYRIVFNSGDNGGQTVYHLHLHILGGRVMRWPPG